MDNRTKKVIYNVGISFILKGGSVLISFLLVPLTLGYLNEYEYGVWLTLNSVLSWVYVFDIGLGNGMRNRLTEALANNEVEKGKIYVSTTFFCLSIIVVVIYLIFLLLQVFLNWDSILNVNPEKIPNLNSIVTLVFGFFCLNFIFRLVGNIYMAYQKPAMNDLYAFIGSVFSLLIIYTLTKFTDGSLLYVALTFSAIPVLVYMIGCKFAFSAYKEIKPSIRFIKLSYAKDLTGLGVKFLIIQLSSIVVFMTSNILISHLFGPSEVTPYNIAFKYFSVFTMGFTIIITPIWSAVTDAYVKGDFIWMKNTVRKLIYIWGGMTVVVAVFIYISGFVYRIWIGRETIIPFSLTIGCGIYVVISMWNNIFAYVIAGMGKLKLQLYSSVIQGLLFIPLAILLAKSFGITGVISALSLTLLLSSIWTPIQCFKLFNQTAKGIWNK